MAKQKKCRDCKYFKWVGNFRTTATCNLQPGKIKDNESRACRFFDQDGTYNSEVCDICGKYFPPHASTGHKNVDAALAKVTTCGGCLIDKIRETKNV